MLTTQTLGTNYTSRHVMVVPGKECQGPATWQGTRLKSAISAKWLLFLLIRAEVKYPESIICIPQDTASSHAVLAKQSEQMVVDLVNCGLRGKTENTTFLHLFKRLYLCRQRWLWALPWHSKPWWITPTNGSHLWQSGKQRMWHECLRTQVLITLWKTKRFTIWWPEVTLQALTSNVFTRPVSFCHYNKIPKIASSWREKHLSCLSVNGCSPALRNLITLGLCWGSSRMRACARADCSTGEHATRDTGTSPQIVPPTEKFHHLPVALGTTSLKYGPLQGTLNIQTTGLV